MVMWPNYCIIIAFHGIIATILVELIKTTVVN